MQSPEWGRWDIIEIHFDATVMRTPHLGVGLGYRVAHHDDIVRHRDEIDFLEVISDQFLYATDEKLEAMLAAASGLPLVSHSLALSVGTATSLDENYVARNADFVQRINASWFSDHLSFTKVPEIDLGTLIPLWFTEEVVETVVKNIMTVKSALPDTLFLVENITYYFSMAKNEMSEAEFITRILELTGCGLLLDLENVYINSYNLKFDPYAFLDDLPLERVVQIHIAGHGAPADMILDTHDHPVSQEVWELLEYVVKRSPVRSILLERDDESPSFGGIMEELAHARRILAMR